ncbi:MAG TPA: HAMP domain-containing sensor histidine kinase [Micromonosporaceae bacterium]|jgi:two-component system, OmpR family, sensor kinase
MSSSQPTETHGPAVRRWPARPWSLRARLLAAILALVAVVCLVIGVATTVALRHFLIGQLDTQLAAASARTAGPPPPRHQADDDRDLFPPGQAAGTMGVRIANGRVQAQGVLDPGGVEQSLTAEQLAMLTALPTDGKARTQGLDELGDYRVVATRAPDGDVLVTGLPMSGVHETVWNVVAIEIAVIGGGLLVAGAVGAGIVRISLRPLRRVAATASRVAELPLDRGEVALSVRVPNGDTHPGTEVGQVGSAFNRMLGHVAGALSARQASEMRVRQFVADASHELRTPLAAIRGYAELTRRGRETLPPDIAHALRRVESESDRMTELVDDLLLLARLDSGRPLDRERVDLSRLAVDAVGDAHVAGPDHRWLLDVPEDEVCVPGDAARLHQVLANLLANARTHTPPGTKVTTALTVDGDHAVLSVVDDGPGIAAQAQPEVFERFVRGDSSRSRAAGSTGLGLAIVAAVVEAHGGTVELESPPGHTEFAVRLPRDA